MSIITPSVERIEHQYQQEFVPYQRMHDFRLLHGRVLSDAALRPVRRDPAAIRAERVRQQQLG